MERGSASWNDEFGLARAESESGSFWSAVAPDGSIGAQIATRIRQTYLDALPIAAAVISAAADGSSNVAASNTAYDRIALSLGGGLIRREPFAAAVAAFLFGDQNPVRFDWTTDESAGARHFVVRLSRLEPVAGLAWRCLLSLVERTAEVESSR